MPTAVEWALLAAWATFGVVWIAGAFRTARTVRSSPGWDRLLLALALVAGLAALRVGGGAGGLGARVLPDALPLVALGLALLYAGLGFAVWARVHLGRLWSGRVTLKEGHLIVRSGPYGLVRHPIYTGILAMALGSALALGRAGLLAVFAVLLATFLLKMRAEERILTERFGDEYRAYAREVKRLVPGVW